MLIQVTQIRRESRVGKTPGRVEEDVVFIDSEDIGKVGDRKGSTFIFLKSDGIMEVKETVQQIVTVANREAKVLKEIRDLISEFVVYYKEVNYVS